MTEHGLPPPMPLTPQDMLQGPIILTASLIVAALLGLFGADPYYPAPLAVIAAVTWHAQRKRRNAAHGQGSPMLLGYLLQFAVFIYVAYGTGRFLADQMY